VDDSNINMMLICPEAKFLGGTAPTKVLTVSGSAPRGSKSTINTAIPAGCKTVVNAFNATYPTMLLRDLVKKGKIKYKSIKVGSRGDCTSFGLLGRCGSCTYQHAVCTVAPEQCVAISNSLQAAMTALKRPAASA
jgi:hypothetical protein